MRKRRKVLVLLGLVVLAAVCFVTLRPPDEPKYHGRYLGEWMEILSQAKPGALTLEAERAVQAIGTNGIPCYLEWMRYQTPRWRMTFTDRLPRWVRSKRMVFAWRLDIAGQQRARNGVTGFRILGTNAASAIPQLKAMLSGRFGPDGSDRAMKALVFIGEAGIPVLEAAFADPQRANRWYILSGFRDMIRAGHTNRCLPTLVAALTNADVYVRLAATNFVQQLAPEVLTNAPAK